MRSRRIKRFGGRFEGDECIHAIEGLWLFLRVGAEGTRRSNLWLNAAVLSKGAALVVGDDVVIAGLACLYLC